MKYEEKEARGSFDFPISYYYLDRSHLRYTMRCHWHREPELIHVLSGTLALTIGGEHFEGRPGDIFYVNSTDLHSAIPKDCVYECTVCESALLGEECNRLLSEYVFPIRLSGQAKVFAAHILKALSEKPSGWKLSVRGAFQAMFGEFLSGGGYAGRSPVRTQHSVKKAITFIEGHFTEPITLDMLSDVCGLSPKYFERVFKEMTGKPPIRYINAYRVYKACSQLRMTDDPVTEIAYSCGFGDLSYFIKQFKSTYGLSPAAFRKIQKNIPDT